MSDIHDMLIFSPCPIGRKTASNRFLSQPMEANDGDPGGKVSERTLERHKHLARGEWGIVVVESVAVTPTSAACPHGLIISQKNLDSFKRLVDEVKAINSVALLFFQITHSGLKSYSPAPVKSIWPSDVEGRESLSTDEIEDIRKAFVEGALLAEEAGADGVDVKLCHGYFGTEMLRPVNTRPDQWGGSFENRTRFLRESIKEIQSKRKHSDFVLGSRISMYEGLRGGCGTAGSDELIEDLSETIQLIKLMDELGMAYVNVSAGEPKFLPAITIPTKPSKEFYLDHFRYTKLAKDVAGSLKVIGSAYTILQEEAHIYAEENIRKGYTDVAGFGRQALADPLYPQKLKNGETIKYCTLCSGCGRLIEHQVHSGCVVYNPYYQDLYQRIQKK
jgi:2,4-dienoyl-CoA reductase-like NADH-dependent reductase (Old Yellow Enzyme family)